MGKIFLSYRRDDSAGYVRAVRSDMNHRFGGRHVFLDVKDIVAGTDFVSIIEEAVSRCEALLAFIGPSWLTVTNNSGRRRLDESRDFVRLEIATALRRDVRVIPVLVSDQEMPSEDSLPDDLKPLARLQAVSLSSERWDDDIKRLFHNIDRATDELKLSKQYADAQALLDGGRWHEALPDFQSIESIRHEYRDLADKLPPLRELATATARLGPAPGGWQKAVYRFPLLAMLLFGALPNGIAALFNFYYNWQAIVLPMQHRGVVQAEYLFQAAAVLVNSVGFAAGFGLFAHLALPVPQLLQDLRSGAAASLQQLTAVRTRCLKLGHYAALIGIALWALVGPVYPLTMDALEPHDYFYFSVSLALCGVIAATYPFLGVTWLCVRVFTLPMIQPGSATAADLAPIQWVERWNWRYLLLAGVLPMLAITLLLMLSTPASSASNSILPGVLGIGGVGGFLLAIRLFRLIQSDLAVLKQVIARSMCARRPESEIPVPADRI